MGNSQFKPPWWQSSLFLIILLITGYGMAFSGNQSLAVPGVLLVTFGIPIILIFVCHRIEKSPLYSEQEIDRRKKIIEGLKEDIDEINNELNALKAEYRQSLALS